MKQMRCVSQWIVLALASLAAQRAVADITIGDQLLGIQTNWRVWGSTDDNNPVSGYTVSPGAKVLVVRVVTGNGGTMPATITWNGSTLTQAVYVQGSASSRQGAIYYLFNPPAGGPGKLGPVGAVPIGWQRDVFTLAGVDTSVLPLTATAANPNVSGYQLLTNTVTGVKHGSCAVVNEFGATGPANFAVSATPVPTGLVQQLSLISTTAGANLNMFSSGFFVTGLRAGALSVVGTVLPSSSDTLRHAMETAVFAPISLHGALFTVR